MSLESQLAELTEAVRENSELLKFMTSHARKADGDKDGGSRSRTSKDEEEDDGKEKTTTRRRSSAKDNKDDDGDDGKTTSRGRSAKVKVPTSKEISAATTKYLEVDDQDEYDHRREIILKIVDKFGVKKMSEIEEDDRTEAMDLLNQALEGKNPFKRSRRDDDVA